MPRTEGGYVYSGLEIELRRSAQVAAEFFTKKKYAVEIGGIDDTYPLQEVHEVGCGDDRYANNGGNMLNDGYATRASLIGGAHLVIAETTNGRYGSAKIVHDFAKHYGITLTYHGDSNNGLDGCAAYKLLKDNNYTVPPDLKSGHPGILYHSLSGDHTADSIKLNFLPFTAAARTRNSITHDFGTSHILGIKDERVIGFIYKLSYELGIHKVKIII